MKTRDLTGAALDWAVAKALGATGLYYDSVATWWVKLDGKDRALTPGWAQSFCPSTNWADAGAIVGQHAISIIRCDDDYGRDAKGFTTNERIPVWGASAGQQSADGVYGPQGDNWGKVYSIDVEDVFYGPTPLVAAMRAFVAQQLGLIIFNLPEGLK